jgi:hypothetical protein
LTDVSDVFTAPIIREMSNPCFRKRGKKQESIPIKLETRLDKQHGSQWEMYGTTAWPKGGGI